MNCDFCNCEMVDGIALAQTYVGLPDFPNCSLVVTFSPGGPGYLVDCWKCPQCGRSVTKLTKDNGREAPRVRK
jgi:hypothetical protein